MLQTLNPMHEKYHEIKEKIHDLWIYDMRYIIVIIGQTFSAHLIAKHS